VDHVRLLAPGKPFDALNAPRGVCHPAILAQVAPATALIFSYLIFS
jgi:hypothetical protein